MKHDTILVDSIYLNSEGGKAILFQFIHYLIEKKINENYYFLIDKRVSKKNILLNKINCEFIKPSETKRKFFYLKNKTKYNSILCFSNVPPPIRLNQSVFIYFHNDLLLNPINTNLSFYDRAKNLLKKSYIKFLNQKNYQWIVQTELIKNKVSYSFSVSGNRIKVFPIFDSKYNNLKLNKGKNRFLYVSNLSKHKNHQKLLNAFINSASKSDELIELHLTILEDEYYQSIYNNKIVSKNLKIINHGVLNKNDLYTLYNLSNFLIFPSLNESFGLPLIESINNNCRVIAADLEYVHEIIEPSLKFDPNSESSISKSILLAVEEKNLNDSKIIVENKIDTFVEYILNHV